VLSELRSEDPFWIKELSLSVSDSWDLVHGGWLNYGVVLAVNRLIAKTSGADSSPAAVSHWIYCLSANVSDILTV